MRRLRRAEESLGDSVVQDPSLLGEILRHGSYDLRLAVRNGRIIAATAGCEVLALVFNRSTLQGQPLDQLLRVDEELELQAWLEGEQVRRPWRAEVIDSSVANPCSWVVLEGWQQPVELEDGPAIQIELDPLSTLSAVLEVVRRRVGQLDLAIRSTGGGMWDVVLDPEDPHAIRACSISPEVKALLGYAPDEFPDSIHAFRAQVHPEDGHLMDQAMADHMSGRTERHDVEYRVQHRDGSYRWLRSCGKVLRDAAGRPIRWVGMEQDISERRQRDEELRRSQHKFAALFRLSPVVIGLVSFPEGRFLEVNGAFLRQLGYQREAVLGRTSKELGLWRDFADRGQLIEKLARWERVEGLRARMITAAGEELAVELAAERLNLEGQDCSLIVGRDVTSELEEEERLVLQAYRDPLTGLGNRQSCEDGLAHALAASVEDGSRTAVFFIDLDRMKAINDSLGHRAGDELLVVAAQRFRQALRKPDLLARFGGDEMVAIAQVRDEGEAMAIGERLRSRYGQSLVINGTPLRPSASIGIALAPSGGEIKPADLLRFADIAMYRAKRAGGDGVQLFDPHLDGEELRDMETETALNVSLDQGELELHYQPIVWLGDLSLWGAEALLRWKHPRHGYVPPARFIPMAEANGMILPIGLWVLEESCRQLADWRRRERVPDDFVMSINVSARQLLGQAFVERVAQVLRETGVPAHCLQIELTERVALDAPAAARELEHLGVRIAVDDFGEGYGSLSYLRKLPVQTLKVDRSFTRDLTTDSVDLGLVRTIVFLADTLGHEVIAEGVETPEQLRCLREMGCGLGQGFLFAEALSAEQLEEVAALRRHRRDAA